MVSCLHSLITRATVSTAILAAPLCFKILAHSLRVAPVVNTSSMTSTVFPRTSRLLVRHRECAAHVAAALAARQTCLDLGWTCAQQPMPGQGDSNNAAQVPGYLTGLVEPALPLAGRMQRNGNQPVGLKSLTVCFIGAGEPHSQRPRKAWMAAILELMNDFFHGVLKGAQARATSKRYRFRRQAPHSAFSAEMAFDGTRSRKLCKRALQSVWRCPSKTDKRLPSLRSSTTLWQSLQVVGSRTVERELKAVKRI